METEQVILNRKRVVHSLINDKYLQNHSCDLYDRHNGSFCAIGASLYLLEGQKFIDNETGVDPTYDSYDRFCELVDVDHETMQNIYAMNDIRLRSLPFIGRCLEKLWKMNTSIA